MGQAYKDYAVFDKAEQLFTKVKKKNFSKFYVLQGIQVDKSYSGGYYLRGLARFGVGDHRLNSM